MDIPDRIIADLRRRYGEPQRAYHTWAHIEDLLAQFERHATAIEHPAAFRLAILFHDAVYDPRAADNEARSAALLEESMTGTVNPADVACARDLILATHKHDTSAVHARCLADAELFLDMDLSILGADAQRFAAYDAAIRREYNFIPIAQYRSGRAAVLQRFLGRPQIFLTGDYRSRLETPARANLQRAIAQLQRGEPV